MQVAITAGQLLVALMLLEHTLFTRGFCPAIFTREHSERIVRMWAIDRPGSDTKSALSQVKQPLMSTEYLRSPTRRVHTHSQAEMARLFCLLVLCSRPEGAPPLRARSRRAAPRGPHRMMSATSHTASAEMLGSHVMLGSPDPKQARRQVEQHEQLVRESNRDRESHVTRENTCIMARAISQASADRTGDRAGDPSTPQPRRKGVRLAEAPVSSERSDETDEADEDEEGDDQSFESVGGRPPNPVPRSSEMA